MKKWLISGFVIILILLIFLPKIASTNMFKPFFVKRLEQRSDAQVEIGSLRFSWLGSQKFRNIKWTKDSVHGSIEELEIIAPFWSFSGPFQLKNGSVSYLGGSLNEIQGTFENHAFSLSAESLRGHLSLQGMIYSKLHFHLQIDIKEFPLIIVNSKLDELLGPTLDLYGAIRMDRGVGDIDLNISSENLKTHLVGNLDKSGFGLKEPLFASLKLTPALSSILLKDANPLFLTSLSSESPITLRIEKDDFHCPVPFKKEQLQIGKATLDLGKVRCKNGKTLASIIALLKTGPLSGIEEMSAWFTPLDIQVQKGILQAGRMDALLADSIRVCTWGQVNLVKDQIKMTLGLTEQTLATAFGIKNLPEDYVLKVDIRGTTSDPEVVKGPAIAKIAALIAANQVPKKGILGGLVNVFSTPKQEGVPPPKKPFPWEK